MGFVWLPREPLGRLGNLGARRRRVEYLRDHLSLCAPIILRLGIGKLPGEWQQVVVEDARDAIGHLGALNLHVLDVAAQRERLEPLLKVHLVVGIAHLQLIARPASALLEILPLLALLGLVEDLRHVGVLCAREAGLDVERRQVAVHLVDRLPDHGWLRRDPLIAHDVAFGQLVDKRGHVH